MPLTIGTCVLGDVPRVALAIRDAMPQETLAAYHAQGGDIVELRIDQFSDVTPPHVTEQIRNVTGMPRIGTIRRREEGGGWAGTEQDRLALYQTVIGHVEAVDIEINADEINRPIVEASRQKQIPIIGSFHDFEATPDINTLENVCAKGNALGVDIIKIACQCANGSDVRTLARLLIEQHEQNLVVIGMGAAAAATRLFFPALGSLLVYTFLGAPTAPGQLCWAETLDLIKTFYIR